MILHLGWFDLYVEYYLISIAHRISHGTNVVVVSIQSNSSDKILLLADGLFTTTTLVPWDFLWTVLINQRLRNLPKPC